MDMTSKENVATSREGILPTGFPDRSGWILVRAPDPGGEGGRSNSKTGARTAWHTHRSGRRWSSRAGLGWGRVREVHRKIHVQRDVCGFRRA